MNNKWQVDVLMAGGMYKRFHAPGKTPKDALDAVKEGVDKDLYPVFDWSTAIIEFIEEPMMNKYDVIVPFGPGVASYRCIRVEAPNKTEALVLARRKFDDKVHPRPRWQEVHVYKCTDGDGG